MTGFGKAKYGEGERVARALDAGAVIVEIPEKYLSDQVRYIADVLDQNATVSKPARVLFDRATNIVVVSGAVKVSPGVLSHRDLTVTLTPQAAGEADAPEYQLEDQDQRTVIELKGHETTPNLQKLIHTLNAMGARTSDVITILQKLKANGMLHAEVVVE